MASGKTNRTVAETLFLSEKTVETHLARIYDELGVRSRTVLATIVAREGGASCPNRLPADPLLTLRTDGIGGRFGDFTDTGVDAGCHAAGDPTPPRPHPRTDPPNPLPGIRVDEIADDYERRDLVGLDDQRLVDSAAAIGVPRDEVVGDRYSFVLHAPPGLLARAALLPYVAPDAVRGPGCASRRWPRDTRPVGRPRRSAAGTLRLARRRRATLVGAIDAGDLDDVDTAATWLGARPAEPARSAARRHRPRPAQRGRARQHLSRLLGRTQPRGVAGQMLRHPARESRRGRYAASVCRPRTASSTFAAATLLELLGLLRDQKAIGPPHSLFIAAVARVRAGAGRVRAVPRRPRVRRPRPHALRAAPVRRPRDAQGPDEHAPYGWTHCLTLAEAPLLIADSCSDPGRASFVSLAYLAAHWAGLGRGMVENWFSPRAVEASVDEALADSPAVAAAAAWHTADPARTLTALATSASLAHDVHRVKYTLACLDAAAADPVQRRLYLAAAAYPTRGGATIPIPPIHWKICHADRARDRDPPTDRGRRPRDRSDVRPVQSRVSLRALPRAAPHDSRRPPHAGARASDGNEAWVGVTADDPGQVIALRELGAAFGTDAELALIVEDSWQRRGVGSSFLRLMAARAREAGVCRLTASVLTESRHVLRMLRRVLGPRIPPASTAI